MKLYTTLLLVVFATTLHAQISETPHFESFENTFTVGSNISFISNWIGNEVTASRKIYQGTDAHTGDKSLNIIPTSSFKGEILVNLDLTDNENTSISFYAKSKQNGASSSDRPAILSISTSTDGGLSYSYERQIGEDSTFPNSNNASFQKFSYDLPIEASDNKDVIIKIMVERGSGQGSSAILVIDDFLIEEKVPELRINKLSARSKDTLEIAFNQEVSRVSIEDTSNYVLSHGLSVVGATQFSGNAAYLLVNKPLVNNTYNLVAHRIQSAITNIITDSLSAQVKFETPTTTRAIVINEIFADPVGTYAPSEEFLPTESSAEFVELYNSTNRAIDITGFELSGSTIDSMILESNSYVIVTATANLNTYREFGATVGVNSWNTLSNSGEAITLKDNLGNLLDSLVYDLNWYQDGEKSAGGWSLEQVNPELPCSDANNWNSAINNGGATPGRTNSRYNILPDTIPPFITAVEILTPIQIQVQFNEPMDINSLSFGTYSITNQDLIWSVNEVTPEIKTVDLTLSDTLISNQEYSIEVSGVSDCSGNILASSTLKFFFDNQPPLLEYVSLRDTTHLDLIFNEPLGFQAAAELSNYLIEPSYTSVIKAVREDNKPNRVSLELDAALKKDSIYQFSFRNISDTLGNNLDLASTSFKFEDRLDTILLISDKLLDLVFKDPIDKTQAEQVENYTLNRDIAHPIVAIIDADTSNIVHLIFDNAFPQNKPIIASFDNLKDDNLNHLQALNRSFIYDTDDPNVDSITMLNAHELQLFFDEQIDIISAESLSSYQLNSNSEPVRASLSPIKRSVTIYFEDAFEPESSNVLSVKNVADLWGNAMTSTRNFEFVYDKLAPRLISIDVLTPKILKVGFSEPLEKIIAENVSNYRIDNDIGNPSVATLSQRDQNILFLEFEGVGNNLINTLSITNLTDLKGNSIENSLTTSFSSMVPKLGQIKVLSDRQVALQFTKPIKQSSSSALQNYIVGNDLTLFSISHDSIDHSRILLNFGQKILPDTDHGLKISGLEDTYGNQFIDLDTTFSYSNPVERIEILSKNSINISFRDQLGKVNTELINNFLIDQSIGNPLLAELDVENQKDIVLFFEKPLIDNQSYTLQLTNLRDEFDEKLPDISIDFNYDVTAPKIASVSSIYLNQVAVTFNEPVDLNTAETTNHYTLNGSVGPIEVTLDEAQIIALLTFENELAHDSSYTLSVKRVKDKHNNQLDSVDVEFVHTKPYLPDFREIVINEVLFEPNSESNLPNHEFVELYNKGTKSILLTDFILTDGSDTAQLPSLALESRDYMIVTTNSGESSYLEYGTTIGITDFPNLSNNGETLWFLDRNGAIIDSVSFSRASYNDTVRNSSGYSLELINPDKPCFDQLNYGASRSLTRGSPGRQNSIFNNDLDIEAPQVTQFKELSRTRLLLNFNEGIDIATFQPANFQLSYDNPIAYIDSISTFGKQIVLNLSEPFMKGAPLGLNVSNIRDCTGNTLADTTLVFFHGIEPNPADLVITEVMVNPTPSQGLPETEYVELLNTSEKIISTEGLFLADATSSTELLRYDLKPHEYLVLLPQSAVERYQDLANKLAANDWPSLNNTADQVSIYKRSGEEISSVNYSNDWYRDEVKASGGFSLEMIDPAFPCLLESNWTASQSTVGGTPGLVNSVNGDNPDNTGPKLVSAVSLNPSSIQIDFDEKIDLESVDIENFAIDADISFIAAVPNINQNSIVLTTSEDLAKNSVYTLSIAHITDCSGNLIHTDHNQIDLIIAGESDPQDIIINEILFNPTTGGVRFIEIYNQSEKYLNLKNWVLGGSSNQVPLTDQNYFIAPYTFHLVTDDGAILLSKYPNAVLENLIEVRSLPSFPSDEGEVFLLNQNSLEIDQFAYDEAYHSPFLNILDGVSLERLSFSSHSNDPNNWFSASATENFATPGYENSQVIRINTSNQKLRVEPMTFAPEIPGANNFTTMTYSFETPGNLIDLKIISSNGLLIKHLVKNTLVGAEGFFKWDGSNDSGQKARVGYYMVLCKVISTNGEVDIITNKVAIGR
ncbi:lamin tail domain-containing protein [Roseivirga misakiensis]|uniref:LTD domain-containing protein n=1 Tax=Roseivirga misakiensis TaxID=1563681 RepID=A0A1E5T631_9BACT|nr:lamin tail domain-containing protein [Roseivirga misakiensis]OEK06842.1 hypothetical protein BFP71_04065 [Roseivirga misakiensis]